MKIHDFKGNLTDTAAEAYSLIYLPPNKSKVAHAYLYGLVKTKSKVIG